MRRDTSWPTAIASWPSTGSPIRTKTTSRTRHRVGVGLQTELRVGLKLQLFDLLTLKPLVPNALEAESATLEVQSLGCDSTSNYEALAIRPPSAGMHPLKLTADNAPEALVYDLQAKDVARIRFFRGADGAPMPVGSQSSYHFVRSEMPLAPSYADAAGAALRGVAPVLVSTNDAAANVVLRGSTIFTGTNPNLVTVGSGASAIKHTLHVVDTSAVASVGGLVPKPGLNATSCVESHAVAASGQPILGHSPIRPRLSFGGGDACAMVGGLTGDTTLSSKPGELCASAVAPGRPTTEVQIAWGSATATWPCQAPPR